MKRRAIALGGVLAVMVIGGTFAYFNQTLTAENMFDTGIYDTELVEDFKPGEGENWEPGASVNKDVTVKNTGTVPVVVRVRFQEKWTKKKDPSRVLYEVDTTINKNALATSSDAQNKFESVYQGSDSDGKTGADVDDSVVRKDMDPDHMWMYYAEDGYYYYKHVIPGMAADGTVFETEKLLDGVTLSEDVDMGAYTEMKFYTTYDRAASADAVPAEAWKEFDKEDGVYVSTKTMRDRLKPVQITFMKSVTNQKENTGYSNADYTLTVTAQTIQATKGAVDAMFGKIPAGLDWKLTEEYQPAGN